MIRRSIATPCPIPTAIDDLLTNEIDEPTATLNFTSEFRASLRNAKPRRSVQPFARFTIHEDIEEDQNAPFERRSTLSQPPRRIKVPDSEQFSEKNSLSVATEAVNVAEKFSRQKTSKAQLNETARKPPRTRVSIVPGTMTNDPIPKPKPSSPKIARPPRRGTIYIPNDDTTMPSIYMGIFSPIKDLGQQDNPVKDLQSPAEVTGIAAQMALKRGRRKSIMSDPPRRGPLQPSLRIIQETAQTEDRHGQGHGKENVPPGADDMSRVAKPSTIKSGHSGPRRSSIYKPTFTGCENRNQHPLLVPSLLTQKTSEISKPTKMQSKPAWNGGTSMKPTHTITVHPAATKAPPISSLMHASTAKPRVPTRFIVPDAQSDPALQNHALLSENIANPILYEEDWLEHQEIAITQLINNLFSAGTTDTFSEHCALRHGLLDLYNQSSMVLMYNRLQAALLYGALSVPQDLLEQGARLQNDIGLRKCFTDLWLSSYDLNALEAALEVVVGRQCRSQKLRTSTGSSPSTKCNKAGLRQYIEAFLIRNEDAKPARDARSRDAWCYQRTILRSLMLAKVLDLVKVEGRIHYPGCLFQNDSAFKSSDSVVQALIQMLNPAVGDPRRILNHIHYVVSHVQHPLEEFSYRIDNIAIDLRDGVRLTRLVELLQYPSPSRAINKAFDADATTTLLMPEGETVELSNGQNWPLSQHLKTSCQSRAVRIWNVELALSAIRNVSGMRDMTHDVSAEDIVNGYREKTVRLLWALVSKWGLAGLLDWQDIKWEIRRLSAIVPDSRSTMDSYEDEFDSEEYSFERCRVLLRRWVRAVTASKGVTIRNYTTSFADGRAFEAIVDEYERYIQQGDVKNASTISLVEKLARLGCSAQFAQLFAKPGMGHVFDRDFVLAALAFLCSRLLAPTKRARAATTIQIAWRRHWSKIVVARREEKKAIALACVNLVESKRTTLSTESHKYSIFGRSPNHPCPNAIEPDQDLISPRREDIWLSL